MLYYLIVLYFIFIAIPIVISIIYDKRDPVKSISWILVVVFLPFIGSFLYLSIGQNFRKRKLFSRKSAQDFQYTNSLISKQLYQINSPLMDDGSFTPLRRDIATLLLNINKSPILENSRCDLLTSGRDCFDAIKEAMLEAKSSIHIEYYMFKDDKIGGEIADILLLKAAEGVEVRLIYDDVGSWTLPKKFIAKMIAGGIEIYPFMPVYFPLFTSKINYRNHRKIVVIDGKIGFTGGINVADKYIDGLENIGAWRDIHIKIEGRSVSALQRIFMADWSFVSRMKLDISSKYFPLFKKTDTRSIPIQIASSGPDSDWATIMNTFFAAITKAKESIYIATPYFLPNQAILMALKVAALSGIDVKLILPGRSDSKVTSSASRSYITELMESGVEVYLYRSGFIHSKIMIIDNSICSIGSANMDIRSFEDNFEVTAFIYDKHTTEQVADIFNEDLSSSRMVKSRWWLSRSIHHRLYEATARLLAPML